MIKPALELVQSYRVLYFIADYHALTTERNYDFLKNEHLIHINLMEGYSWETMWPKN